MMPSMMRLVMRFDVLMLMWQAADVSLTLGPLRPEHIPDFTRIAFGDRNSDHARQ